MGHCDGSATAAGAPVRDAADAAAASRRLDDTFRTYLGERGAKALPLAEVASLVTGVASLRLAGDAVLDLWKRTASVDGDRTAARAELMASAERVRDWYDDFAGSLIGRGAVPDPLIADEGGDGRLLDAVSHDLVSTSGQASATGVRMIWTGDHLDAARRLQSVLVPPARAALGEKSVSETGRPA